MGTAALIPLLTVRARIRRLVKRARVRRCTRNLGDAARGARCPTEALNAGPVNSGRFGIEPQRGKKEVLGTLSPLEWEMTVRLATAIGACVKALAGHDDAQVEVLFPVSAEDRVKAEDAVAAIMATTAQERAQQAPLPTLMRAADLMREYGTQWNGQMPLLSSAPEGDKPAIDEPAHAPEKSSGGDEGGQGSAPS